MALSLAWPKFDSFLPRAVGLKGIRWLQHHPSALPGPARVSDSTAAFTQWFDSGRAFMTVHLLANASVLESPGTFQRAVYQIHSLGKLLPVVEWGFIFLPILFHAICWAS